MILFIHAIFSKILMKRGLAKMNLKKKYLMKNLAVKRFRFILLTLILLLITSPITFSTHNGINPPITTSSFQLLKEMHLLSGSATVSTSEKDQLKKPLTQLEGYILVLKLMGHESEILKQPDAISYFSDVPNWAKSYINFAYSLGLITGVTSDKWGAADPLTWSRFVYLLLETTPYAAEKDAYTDSSAIQFAFDHQIIDKKYLTLSKNSDLKKGYALDLIVAFLNTKAVNGETLAAHLHQLGALTKDAFTLFEDTLKQNKLIPYATISAQEISLFQKDIQNMFKTVSSKYDLDYEKVGIYLEELETGLTWTMGNELVKDYSTGLYKGKFSAASAVKFPMAMATLEYLKSNQISLKNTFTDRLSKNSYAFDRTISLMISHSRTDYYNYLIRFMGVKEVNQQLKSLGIENSIIKGELGGGDPFWSLERMKKEYGTTVPSKFTPSDFGRLLRIVYDGVQQNDAYMTLLNQALLKNIYSSRIPRGIQYKYPVAHKTGTYEEEGRFLDAGIVYLPENPYAIVLIVDGQKEVKICEPFMREMAKEINRYLEKRKP